jgi:hypothetical protein
MGSARPLYKFKNRLDLSWVIMLFTNQLHPVFKNHSKHRSKALKLEEFLVKAKSNAYATGGEGGERVLADGCKELAFQEGHFNYRDRYFGWNPFAGEEVVWRDDKVIWAMNYYGIVLHEAVPAGQVYRFLRQALQQVTGDRPFRGPSYLRDADFEYRDVSQGTVERFTGSERIYYQGQEIYCLDYHGGIVKSK